MNIHKRFLLFLIKLLLLLVLLPSSAFAQLNIFACAPEWGALAKEIGGTQVSVYAASNAAQDIHHLRARPSF